MRLPVMLLLFNLVVGGGMCKWYVVMVLCNVGFFSLR